MLTRLTATASVVILGAALAVALPAGPAHADCVVVNDVISCAASDADQKRGSGGSSDGGNGSNNSPDLCTGLPNGLPGVACTINAPAPVQRIPSIDLAQQARGDLELPAPHIHWSPQPRTYVELRTGLWVDPADFGRFDKSVTAGGQVVTAHATPKYVTWNLVETTIHCRNAGGADGTACGYTYQHSSADHPDGTYHITATITWGVTWNCAGDCDPGAGSALDDISMASAAQLPVDEIQTESQPG
jgi:hypothetical protein